MIDLDFSMNNPVIREMNAVMSLCKRIERLRDYSTQPSSEPLSDEWLSDMRELIHYDAGNAEELAIRIGNSALREKVVRARSVALDYVARLHSDPELAATHVRHWIMQCDRRVVDEMLVLQMELLSIQDVLSTGPCWINANQAGGRARAFGLSEIFE